MSEDRQSRILTSLRELFQAVAEEARANPAFAAKVEASLANAAGIANRTRNLPAPAPKDISKANTILQNVTFDPLEFHIEAALLSGREQEARAFLGKLDRGQLEQVVKAQRLPGAKSLQRAIAEQGTASAVDAILGSATERVRNRLSAAR